MAGQHTITWTSVHQDLWHHMVGITIPQWLKGGNIYIQWNYIAYQKGKTSMKINPTEELVLSKYIPTYTLQDGIILFCPQCVNSLRPRPNRRHFADDIFKCIFENENEWISPRISLKFVSKVRINNIPALVQTVAWRRPGDKPLSEPMMISLPTHICVARPQWVNCLICFHTHSLRTAIAYTAIV